jgi:hypothetical protein
MPMVDMRSLYVSNDTVTMRVLCKGDQIEIWHATGAADLELVAQGHIAHELASATRCGIAVDASSGFGGGTPTWDDVTIWDTSVTGGAQTLESDAPAGVSVLELQASLPEDTIDAGSWTAVGAADLHSAVATANPDTGSYIESGETSTDSVTFKLSALADPGRNDLHRLWVTFRATAPGLSDLALTLLDGETPIAVREIEDVGTDWITVLLEWDDGEIASISDYSNLRLQVDKDVSLL